MIAETLLPFQILLMNLMEKIHLHSCRQGRVTFYYWPFENICSSSTSCWRHPFMVLILHFLLFFSDKGGILLTNFHQASIEIIATWSWDILVLSLSLSVWISSLKGKNSYLVTGVNLLTLGLSVVFRIWAINCCPIMRTSGIHFDPYLPSPLFRGTQRQLSEKYLFGRRFESSNFRNICCKISCLPASPRIFEHLKYGIIAYF